MAIRTAADNPAPGLHQVTWSGLLTTDVGNGVEMAQVGDRGVVLQATGVFGVGGSVNIQGSNDNVNWGVLGSIAAAQGVFLPTSVPRYIRPSIAGGDGTTNVAVIMVW